MSAAAVGTSQTSPPVTVAGGLPDFSERLSPMLVKELRQGMRSPVFVWGLIVMNLFLAMIVWLTIGDPAEDSLHQAFFGGFCALVCGLLPLRAAGALHDELRGNTIDTLVLTRLTGWRITLGKWVAVVAQQCLAAVTVLPYLIVRYFAGGLNVPMELAWLGIFLLVGMGSAAILTGFSWIKYFLFRAGLMMGITFATGAFCVGVLDEIYGYRRNYMLDEIWKDTGWQTFALTLLPALHACFFSLDVGAAKVGALVENRSVRRRCVGLSVIALYLAIGLSWELGGGRRMYGVSFAVTGMLVYGTVILLAVQALLEPPLPFVSVVMPLVKRGWIGRLAGRFFYTGWPSGVVFILSIILMGAGVMAWGTLEYSRHSSVGYGADWMQIGQRDMAYLVGGVGALLGMLPVPLVLWGLFFKTRLAWHFGSYLILLMTTAAVQVAIVAVAVSQENMNILKWGLPIPTMSWAWLPQSVEHAFYSRYGETDGMLDWDYGTITLVSGAVSLMWWLVALLLALRAFRETRSVEREAMALLVKPAAAALEPA